MATYTQIYSKFDPNGNDNINNFLSVAHCILGNIVCAVTTPDRAKKFRVEFIY